MFELQNILEERKSTLDTLMTELLVSEINEREAIHFDSETLINSGLCNALLNRFDQYAGSYIYRIELKNKGDINIIAENFMQFQKLNNVPSNSYKCNVSKFNNTNSKILYLGIKRHKLKTRIKQHLGYGSAKAIALHLKHWLPNNINLKITIYEIDSENNEFLNFLGQGFWDILTPMFGKRKFV